MSLSWFVSHLLTNCTSYEREKLNLLWQRKNIELISLDQQLQQLYLVLAIWTSEGRNIFPHYGLKFFSEWLTAASEQIWAFHSPEWIITSLDFVRLCNLKIRFLLAVIMSLFPAHRSIRCKNNIDKSMQDFSDLYPLHPQSRFLIFCIN